MVASAHFYACVDVALRGMQNPWMLHVATRHACALVTVVSKVCVRIPTEGKASGILDQQLYFVAVALWEALCKLDSE